MINKLREDRFMQKKAESFFAAEVNEGVQTVEIDATVAASDNLLANLPPDSIVTDAYIQVVTASDAVTSATATLGTTVGGSEVLSAADLKAVGKEGTFAGNSLTGSGKELYLGLAYVGGATNVGKYIVVVQYLEYTKNTGEYTRV